MSSFPIPLLEMALPDYKFTDDGNRTRSLIVQHYKSEYPKYESEDLKVLVRDTWIGVGGTDKEANERWEAQVVKVHDEEQLDGTCGDSDESALKELASQYLKDGEREMLGKVLIK